MQAKNLASALDSLPSLALTPFVILTLTLALTTSQPATYAWADLHEPAALPDTFRHVIEPGDSLIRIAGRFRDRTRHYTLGELLEDIRQANAITSDLLQPGQVLCIPAGAEEIHPLVKETVAAGEPVRGIYLTGASCSCASLFARVDSFIAAGGNAVVFDAKDTDGAVTFASVHELASWGAARRAPLIPSLSGMIRRLQQRRLYVIARISVFLDHELGSRRSDLALTDSSGAAWRERGQIWVDPAQPEIRRYNIALARELAAAGVDEVQFDYVRYPTNGWGPDQARDIATEASARSAVITGFLREARNALAKPHIKISADLYGVMAFDRIADQAVTGQDIAAIARCVDVICPMLYPSHFGRGFAGFDRPGDHPAHFVAEGCRLFAELAGGEVEIRPWLQAFPYRTSRYNARYVQVQIDAALAAGAAGWCLWNPAARYETVLAAVAPGGIPAEPAGLCPGGGWGLPQFWSSQPTPRD